MQAGVVIAHHMGEVRPSRSASCQELETALLDMRPRCQSVRHQGGAASHGFPCCETSPGPYDRYELLEALNVNGFGLV